MARGRDEVFQFVDISLNRISDEKWACLDGCLREVGSIKIVHKVRMGCWGIDYMHRRIEMKGSGGAFFRSTNSSVDPIFVSPTVPLSPICTMVHSGAQQHRLFRTGRPAEILGGHMVSVHGCVDSIE